MRRKKRGAKQAIAQVSIPFQLKRQILDGRKTVYGIQFNWCLKESEPKVFAVVGGRCVSVYECLSAEEAFGMKLLQRFEDENVDESFYCCAWTHNLVSSFIVVAGKLGIIHVLNVSTMQSLMHFKHPGEVNDLKISPRYPYLLFSVSADQSIKLWNLQTETLVAVFAGIDGHRDSIVSCDVNPTFEYLVTAGIDVKICIWDLKKLEKHIEYSRRFDISKGRQFQSYVNPFPVFQNRDIHGNYVDCVRWYGEFIISKSCENKVIIWKPNLEDPLNSALIIRKLTVESCEYWYMRFTIDVAYKWLALGNANGHVYLWNLDVEDSGDIECYKLESMSRLVTIRQISFSRDSKILVCACDKGVIKRFDLTQLKAK